MEDRQRIGALAKLPDLLRELDADPAAVLAAAGLPPDGLANAEGSLTFEAVGELLHAAVEATGCPHLGLQLGQRSGLESLGLVGQLMHHAPDLRQAVLDLCVNQQRYVRGSVVYLAVMGQDAYWGYGVHHSGMKAVEHYSEGAVAVGARLLQELTGLSPDAVLLARHAPADTEPYRRHFGVVPQFEAEQNALVFRTHQLGTKVSGADPARRAELERIVAGYWAVKEPTTAQRVSRNLRARVIIEPPTLEGVAADLQMHPRTLNRRLKAEGQSFRDLLNEARFEVARQLLSITSIQIAAIGQALGYADPSGFTRAFERWSGVAPSEFAKLANSK